MGMGEALVKGGHSVIVLLVLGCIGVKVLGLAQKAEDNRRSFAPNSGPLLAASAFQRQHAITRTHEGLKVLVGIGNDSHMRTAKLLCRRWYSYLHHCRRKCGGTCCDNNVNRM